MSHQLCRPEQHAALTPTSRRNIWGFTQQLSQPGEARPDPSNQLAVSTAICSIDLHWTR